MYRYLPVPITVLNTHTIDGGVKPELTIPHQAVPSDVHDWLTENMGWGVAVSRHPDTSERLYEKPNCVPNASLTWCEAVAYESYRFLSLGGKEPLS